MISRYPLVKIGQFLRLRKEFFSIDDTEEYQLVTVQLHSRGIRDRSHLLGSEIKTKKQQRVRSGDLLVAEIDAKVGGYSIVPPELDGAIVSGHYFLYKIDSSQIEPDYLGFYLKTGYPEQDLQQFVKGSVNYAAIKSQHFFELEIPLPPLGDQRRIVRKIEKLALKANQALDLQKRTIEETHELGLIESRKVFEQLSTDYPARPLGEVFSFRNELIRPADKKTGKAVFIGLQHIQSDTGHRIGEELVNIEDLNGRKFRFFPGDVVYGYLRPYLNKVWIADQEGLCSVDQYVLMPDKKVIETEYLTLFMRSPVFVHQAISLTHTLMLPRLRSGLLESIKIPLPEKKRQAAIINHLRSVSDSISQLQRLQDHSRAELEAILPSILDKAFQGYL